MASTIAAVTTGGGGIVQTADASGNLSLLSGPNTIVAVTLAGAAVTGVLSATGAVSGTTGTFSGGVVSTSGAFTSTVSATHNAYQAIIALTDAATIAVDMSATGGNNFSVTLGGNRTLGNPTGLTAGQSGVIYITQDGTGSRTLAYSSFWDFQNTAAPTLSTGIGAVDVLVYSVRSSTSIVAQLITNIG